MKPNVLQSLHSNLNHTKCEQKASLGRTKTHYFGELTDEPCDSWI